MKTIEMLLGAVVVHTIRRKLKSFIAFFFVFVMSSFGAYAEGPYFQNLLTNPDAESGSLSGWTITANGGSGWVVKDYQGSKMFATSYDWAKREQLVDLFALGFSAEELALSPPIEISEDFYKRFDPDYYFLEVELLDENMNVIGAYRSGDKVSTRKPVSEWHDTEFHVFRDYAQGVRYIRWKDGGKDSEYWGNWYGIRMDNAVLKIHSSSVMAKKLINDNEVIQLEASNGQLLSCRDNLLQANETSLSRGCNFTLEYADNAVLLNTDIGYLVVQGSDIVFSGNREEASPLDITLGTNGRLKIVSALHQTNLTLQPGLTEVKMTEYNDFSQVDEFSLYFDEQAAQIDYPAHDPSRSQACITSELVLLWDLTGGFLLATGVGPALTQDEAPLAPGFVALVRANETTSAALDALLQSVSTGELAVPTAALAFSKVLYNEGLLWQALKVAVSQAGWWGATRLVVKVIETIFAPELEVAELAAALLIWGGQTANAVDNVMTHCYSSPSGASL